MDGMLEGLGTGTSIVQRRMSVSHDWVLGEQSEVRKKGVLSKQKNQGMQARQVTRATGGPLCGQAAPPRPQFKSLKLTGQLVFLNQ